VVLRHQLPGIIALSLQHSATTAPAPLRLGQSLPSTAEDSDFSGSLFRQINQPDHPVVDARSPAQCSLVSIPWIRRLRSSLPNVRKAKGLRIWLSSKAFRTRQALLLTQLLLEPLDADPIAWRCPKRLFTTLLPVCSSRPSAIPHTSCQRQNDFVAEVTRLILICSLAFIIGSADEEETAADAVWDVPDSSRGTVSPSVFPVVALKHLTLPHSKRYLGATIGISLAWYFSSTSSSVRVHMLKAAPSP